MTRPSLRRRRRRARPTGFTIVELIIAIVVLAVGVLGLAGTAAMVTRMVGGGARQTRAANVAASRFERLRTLQCTGVASGSATQGDISERWTVSNAGSNLRLVVDTVTFTPATRAPRKVAFQSYVKC